MPALGCVLLGLTVFFLACSIGTNRDGLVGLVFSFLCPIGTNRVGLVELVVVVFYVFCWDQPGWVGWVGCFFFNVFSTLSTENG